MSIRGVMTILWECLDKVLHDLLNGMVADGTVDMLSEKLVPVEKDAFDELASVGDDVDEREESIAGGREPKLPSPVIVISMEQGPGDVRHVESRQEEGCWQADRLDMVFDLGFGVKVVDL
jgi:hypothetical protein